MQKGFNGILLIPFFILSLNLNAQVSSISPYTKVGPGDFFSGDYTRGLGIGGATLSLFDPLNINFNNPASYSALELSTFEVGFEMSLYELEQDNPRILQKNNSAGLRYFSFGVPLFKDWWGSAIGLQPFSFKGYDIQLNRVYEDSINVVDRFRGNGGLNQFFWGNSFEVAKGLSLGFNASYVFGKTEENNFTYWDSQRFLNYKEQEVAQSNGFHFKYGAQYHYLDSARRSLGIGITYANASSLNTEIGSYNYLVGGNMENQVPIDSLSSSGIRDGEIKLPSTFGIGLSYGKFDSLIYNHAWLITADYEMLSGSGYQHYDGTQPLVDSWKMQVGAMVRPRWAFENLKRSLAYFPNVEYRIGGFYEKTPYQIKNTSIYNYGITFGLGLPVRHRNLAPGEQKVSTINTGIVLGRRGTLENNLIRESYVNFYLGITLNDKWFIKYRYR